MPGTEWTLLDTSIVIVYMIFMVGIGVYIGQRINGFDDFFLAGRGLTTPLLVGSLVATYYGLDVTFGSSETSYFEGISTFFVYSAPFYISYILVTFAIAPRIRTLQAASMPEVVGHYYGKSAYVAAAFASALYSMPILSVFGIGIIGEVFFGVDPALAAILGSSIAVIYTLLGGLLADAITDIFQFNVMCVTAAIAAVFAMFYIGSFDTVRPALDASLLQPTGELSAAEIVVYITVALTPLIEPAFYQRILAAKNMRSIRNALLLGIVLWIAFDWVVVYLGIIGRYMVDTHMLPDDIDPSAIILHVTAYLLPTGLLGLFAAGCIATATSTIDSYALIFSGNVVYDGWQTITGKQIPEKRLVAYIRIGVFLSVVLALLVAFRFDRIRDAWIFMASILNSTVLVPMLVVFLFPAFINRRAGAWSSVTGCLTGISFFLIFEAFGTIDETIETRVLLVGETALLREHLALVTLPVAFAAYLLGYLVDRMKKS